MLLVMIALSLFPAVRAAAAPGRNLADVVSGTQLAPARQWFMDWLDDRTYVADWREFYDNTSGTGAWGGSSSSNAIKGIVTAITYETFTDSINGFTIQASVTNDLYDYSGTLTGTAGVNDHGQSAPDIATQSKTAMRHVYLATAFAKDDTTPSLPQSPPFGSEPVIHAANPTALAWYCYNNGPEPPMWSFPSGYWVPAWDMTMNMVSDTKGTPDVIELGDTHTFNLSFTCSPVITKTDPLYNIITRSKNEGKDIFTSRSSSLKVSAFPSTLAFDPGTAYPQDPPHGANVAVFYSTDSVRSGMLWFRSIQINNHTNWPNGSPDILLQMTATADSVENITWQSVTFQALGTGDDAADISSVDVWLDNDADGTINTGDTHIGSGHFSTDNGTLTINLSSPQTIVANRTINMLVSCILSSASPWPGMTYQLMMTNAGAAGVQTQQPASIYGIPIRSAVLTLNTTSTNTLTVHGSALLHDHMWWSSNPDRNNPMLSASVSSNSTNSVILDRILLQASGTGNDVADISSVDVWLDRDPLGVVGTEDTRLGNGTFSSNNGRKSIVLTSPPTIPTGESINLLISYKMNPATGAVGSTYQLQAIDVCAHDAVTGTVLQTNGAPLTGPTTTRVPDPVSIGQAKLAPVGSHVFLANKVVTADLRYPLNLINLYYIEEPNRVAGIGVSASGTDWLSPGQRVNIYGKTRLMDGAELVIDPEQVAVSSGSPVKPLLMNGRSSGGVCTGMLVTIWGSVTDFNFSSIGGLFWIDDGSGIRDGFSAYNGIEVLIPWDISEIPSGYVCATGIMRSIPGPAGIPVRFLVPRSSDDVIIFSSPH